MKWFTVLSTVQLIATFFLLYLVIGLVQDQKTRRAEFPDVNGSDHASKIITNSPATIDASVEHALRRIIGEQLSAHEHTHVSEQINSIRGPDTEKRSDKDTNARMASIENDLEYYFSVGSISENEMASLQGEIAQLDKNNRTLILQKLVKAMNEGRIKGQL